jgi:receptor protein-tyrosine kinase
MAGTRSREVAIDLSRIAQMGMVTPDRSRSSIAEEYRVIKRPILKNVSEGGALNTKLIMVTSSLPGEGKSFTAINLAISIALELDHTVLLVDADVSKPSILKTLGLQPAKGLMDVLSEPNSDLAESLLKTNIQKLSILPAGMPHERATELLASEAMNRILEEMASRYADRVIIFDSPPLIPTTEARVLASHMGQIVMVVEAGRTTNGALRQALSTIDACPIKLMVLNKAHDGGPGGYYGYGYGYGYGHAPEAAVDAA